jgi:Zincin-like metallopeptidase
LGSAFLCADLELRQEPREDNAAYIANWLEVLKNDNRAIFAASAYAQRAPDYLNQKSAAQVPEPARLDLSFRSIVDTEAKEIVVQAKQFYVEVEDWITKNHPPLKM